MSERKGAPLSPFGRVSFESVFVPSSMEENKEKKYGLTLLFPKAVTEPASKADPLGLATQKALYQQMKSAAETAAREMFGVGLGQKTKSGKLIRNPFRDGEEKSHLDGYGEDIIFVRFSGRGKPRVVDQIKRDITPESQDFYSGCWAHVTYTVYAYDKVNAGVSFGLVNVQKVKDGEPFSAGASDPDRDFQEIDVAEVAVGDDDTPF